MSHLSPADLSILLLEPSAMQRKVICSELNAEGVNKIDSCESLADAARNICNASHPILSLAPCISRMVQPPTFWQNCAAHHNSKHSPLC